MVNTLIDGDWSHEILGMDSDFPETAGNLGMESHPN